VQTDSENWAKAQFADLSALGERLAATASRLERTRLIAEYFRQLSPADVEVAARLLLGRPFPEAQGRKLSLGGRAVWEAVEAAGGTPATADWAGVRDFGELVHHAMPSATVAHPLSLAEVDAAFAAIAATAGSGSRLPGVGWSGPD